MKSNLFIFAINIFIQVFTIGIIQADDKCRLNLSWGHGGAPHAEGRINALKVKGRTIGQGCGIANFKYGGVNTQIWQTGYNGDWSSKISLIDNGGLNPIMNPKNLALVNKHKNMKNLKGLKRLIRQYSDDEKNFISKNFSDLGISNAEIKAGIKAVGFVRLTHYHWAALVKEADSLISNGTCKKVSINFICHDEFDIYEGDNGEKKYDEDLGNDTYKKRISRATFGDFFNIDRRALVDARGFAIPYEIQSCGKSSTGKDFESVPQQCGESHIFDADTLKEYKSGSCGGFLSKITSKYNRSRQLLDRHELFDELSINKTLQSYNEEIVEELDDYYRGNECPSF